MVKGGEEFNSSCQEHPGSYHNMNLTQFIYYLDGVFAMTLNLPLIFILIFNSEQFSIK